VTGGGGADVFLIQKGMSTATSFTTINDLKTADGDQLTYAAATTAVVNSSGTSDLTDTITVSSVTTTTTVNNKGVATFSGTATAFDTLSEIVVILDDFMASNSLGNTAGNVIFFRLASDSAAAYAFIENGDAATTTAADAGAIVRLVGISLPSSSTTFDTSGTGIAGFGG